MLGTEVLTPHEIKMLTAAGNTMIVFSAWMLMRWADRKRYAFAAQIAGEEPNRISQIVVELLSAISMTAKAVIVRIGWWVIGLWLAAPGQKYHPMIESWKYLPTWIAAVMIGIAVIRVYEAFPNEYDEKAWRFKFLGGGLAISVATTVFFVAL